MTDQAARLGEVVDSTTTAFVAESDMLHGGPPFGALVTVAEPPHPAVVAIVYDVSTSSLAPGRLALARGRPPDRYDERIYEEFPELRETLRTQFSALVVGYRRADGSYAQSLPPYPAPLHYSVLPCSTEESCAFTARFDFFRTVLDAAGVPADELLAATIASSSALRNGAADDFRLRAGKEVARLLSDDYDRLLGVLRRAREAGR